jgi:hypothetical protein
MAALLLDNGAEIDITDKRNFLSTVLVITDRYGAP